MHGNMGEAWVSCGATEYIRPNDACEVNLRAKRTAAQVKAVWHTQHCVWGWLAVRRMYMHIHMSSVPGRLSECLSTWWCVLS